MAASFFRLNFFYYFIFLLLLRLTLFSDLSLLFLSISFLLYSSLFLSLFSLLSFYPSFPPIPLFLLCPLPPFPSPPLFLLFPASPYSILSVPPFFASLYFSVHTLSFSGFKFLFYHMFHVKHYRSTCQPIPFSNLSFKQSIHF